MSKSKRKIIIILIVLPIIFIVIGSYFTLRRGILFDGYFYYQIDQDNYQHDRENYIEKISQTEYRVKNHGIEKIISVMKKSDTLSFTFPDGTVEEGVWDGRYLINSQGDIEGIEEANFGVNDEYVEPTNISYAMLLCRVIYGETETMSEWYIELAGFFIYLVGIFIFKYPEKCYRHSRRIISNNSELSGFALKVIRIEAVILLTVGIGVMTGAFWVFVY